MSPSSLGSSSSADNPGDSPLLNASRGDSSKTPFSNRESPCNRGTYPSVTPQEEESSRSGYENVRLRLLRIKYTLSISQNYSYV